MQITITARHFDLTNAIRDRVESSCEKLSKYFDQIIHINMILSLVKNRNVVEMTLHASHFNLQSEAEENDMYLSVDNAIDRMEAQLKKLKEKVTNHQKRAIKDNPIYAYANMFERKKTADRRRMVKTKRVMAETMSVHEALDKFENIKKEYLIFRNFETDRINVLVKKDDLHYKLIEP
ncbi:MAG: ribosome-associated translation inhibitor RaiA [Candidatus Cloacimonetes bacterium]|nr:ribosome-associated translation inhibitor RaiA [Candidatus Cloacimonadota bacterium]